MARVEPVHPEKQAESNEPKTRKGGISFRPPGCFGVGLLIATIIIGWVGWLLASAGVIPTPFFTTLQPRRPVIEQMLKANELAQRIAGDSQANGGGTLRISESELSKFLNNELAKLEKPPLETSQLAIDENNIELFGTLPDRPQLAVSITFTLAVADDKLLVKVQSFQLGHLRLPVWMAQAFIGTVLTQSLPRSREVIQPNSIQIYPGSLLFTL
jgi:hypothetical protein